MIWLLLAPTLALLAPGAEALKEGMLCTNVSTYSKVKWDDSEYGCCLSKIVEPDCKYEDKQVCVDMMEVKCEIETWTECKMTPCPVEVDEPSHVPEQFTPIWCEKVYKDQIITKYRPVAVNKSKEVCDTIWKTNDEGVEVWAGEENCKTIYWTVYEEEPYEETIQVKGTDCKEEEPIEYNTCKNKTTTSPQMCTTCTARALPKCSTYPRQECETVSEKTCKPRVEKACDWHYKEPSQTFEHKRRCIRGGHQGVRNGGQQSTSGGASLSSDIILRSNERPRPEDENVEELDYENDIFETVIDEGRVS